MKRLNQAVRLTIRYAAFALFAVVCGCGKDVPQPKELTAEEEKRFMEEYRKNRSNEGGRKAPAE